MASNSPFILDPAEFTASQTQRIHAHVEAYLNAPERTADHEDAGLDALLDEVMPAPPTPVPAVELPAPAPLDDWALDEAQQFGSPPPEAAAWEPYSPPEGGAGGGGGKASSPFLPASPSDQDCDPEPAFDDDPEDFEGRFDLWQPPHHELPPIPDDVADISPVADDLPGLPPSDPDPAAADPPAATAGARRRLSAAWSNLAPWMRIALPTAAVLVVVIVAAMVMSAHDTAAPLDAPPLTAQGPTTAAAAKPLTNLMPDKVDSSCPAGSSPNPGLIFGTDKTQAWICTRIYNIDHATLTIVFSKPVVVASIFVVPGYDYVEANGEDHWDEHRLVTQILWRIGGTQTVQKINPTRGGATLTVANIAAQTITATIQKTQRPPAVPNQSGPLPGILSGPDASKVDASFAIGHITITGSLAGGTR